MAIQNVIIRFVGGPDDGLVVENNSSNPTIAEAAPVCADLLRDKQIGDAYHGVPFTLVLKLASGGTSPQKLTSSGLAQWHAYRVSERKESAGRLEFVMTHDQEFKPPAD